MDAASIATEIADRLQALDAIAATDVTSPTEGFSSIMVRTQGGAYYTVNVIGPAEPGKVETAPATAEGE